MIPLMELKGSRSERVKALDALIARLEQMKRTLGGDVSPTIPPHEVYGRYINAPVWPWFAAGWLLGALFVLLFVAAWSYS